jgi:site-specific DNA-adenine methylase
MSKIFISYRRQDSRPVATLIHESLAKYFEPEFGAGAVFIDVHGIPLGVNICPLHHMTLSNAH